MKVVEVDNVDPQAFKRSFHGAPAIFTGPIDADKLACFKIPHGPELGGNENAVAAVLERLAKQRLIGAADTIHFCRIEMADAQIHRFMQQVDCGTPLHGRAVKLRQAHAAKTYGR